MTSGYEGDVSQIYNLELETDRNSVLAQKPACHTDVSVLVWLRPSKGAVSNGPKFPKQLQITEWSRGKPTPREAGQHIGLH